MAKRKRPKVVDQEGITRSVSETVPTTDDAEAAAWANVSGLAQDALTFWNTFIGLQAGGSALDATGLARLTCIIRAVSWVESQHGTGSGTSASTDPMQCANPKDAWWTELTDCSGTQDRFVRGPGLTPNYNACKLPAAAAADASFPTGASLSNLAAKTDGHNDANFTQLMSYCWGVPFLIWKTNNPTGDPTYQCQNLSRDRLVAGAVAYNGGGDPSYEAKINAALDMTGCFTSSASFLSTRIDPQTIINFCDQEYPSKNDDCNKFVKAVSADLSVTLFQPDDNADAIVQRMRDARDWKRLDNGVDAKKSADAGQYVVAGLKAADHNPPRGHGHVAIVVSGPLASGKYPTGYWGSLDGTPGQSQTLNYAWRAADRDNIEYFAHDLSPTAARGSEFELTPSAHDTAISVMQEIVRQLGKPDEPGKPSKIFPTGIELIYVKVEVGPTKVEVKIAGPKAPGV